MGFIRRLLGRFARRGGDHSIIITFPMPADFGPISRWEFALRFEEALEEALQTTGAGEYDGHGSGEGEYDIFLYGPNADRMWEAIRPVVEAESWPKGSYAIKRFGPPEDGVREDRIELG